MDIDTSRSFGYNESNMTRKNITLAIIVLPAILLPVSASSCNKSPRTNVVVILLDTLRADRLPFYGYAKDTMPFLNTLAPKSTVFAKAYAGSSWTAPATASIFTSLYPFQHGVVMGLAAQLKIITKNPSIKINRIPEDLHTMPEIFKANGYRTFGVSDNANISKHQGFAQGFDTLLNFSHKGAKTVNQKLLELEKEIKSSSRYFLYVHYNDPHRPYKLSLSDEERSGDRIEDFKRIYDKELAYIDERIRQLYQRFGWERNTLIVVTADHGEEMMEKGFYGHGTSLFNTVIHVPLLFYYPGSRSVAAGKVPSSVSTLDILPTLNSLLGFAALKDVSGKDLSPLLKNPGAAVAARHIYSHLQLKKANENDVVHKAALFKDYKYIYQSVGVSSLFFNLKRDPLESKNLYFNNQQLAKKLAASYFSFERSCPRFNPDYVGIQLDSKSIEHLKTLGYIQ
jgi:arylsulfatase A-like enzyme